MVVQRATTVAKQISGRLKNTQAALVSYASLNAALSSVTGAAQEFAEFEADQNAGRFATVNSHLDSLIRELHWVQAYSFRQEATSIVAEAATYAERVRELERATRSELDRLRSQIEAAAKSFTELASTSEAGITETVQRGVDDSALPRPEQRPS